MAEFGRIDLLVYNAGMGPRERVDMLQVGAASYDEVMTTNLKGQYLVMRRWRLPWCRLDGR